MAGVIDTHCHLASAKFAGEAADLIQRATARGVDRMITLATGFDDIPANLALAARYPATVMAAVGIHPCDAHEADVATPWQDALAAAARHPGVVAIGETGLDYFHPPPAGWNEDVYRARQRALLRGHFEVAEATGLGIILHTRDRSGCQSITDALEIARGFAGRVRPMFHCFLGPWDLAAPIIALNGIVSFGGILTFPNARETLAAARAAPEGVFTLETDAPYLAPVPHRGKRNEPAHVINTAAFLADARGETFEHLASHTTATAVRFFNLPDAADCPPAPNGANSSNRAALNLNLNHNRYLNLTPSCPDDYDYEHD